jgi:hypothetical protein
MTNRGEKVNFVALFFFSGGSDKFRRISEVEGGPDSIPDFSELLRR